jgi:hypothetical protein
MKHSLVKGVVLSAISLAISIAQPVAAQSASLPACDEAAVWTVAETSVTDPLGTLWSMYLCTPEGWQLVGESYCSSDGSCSSN